MLTPLLDPGAADETPTASILTSNVVESQVQAETERRDSYFDRRSSLWLGRRYECSAPERHTNGVHGSNGFFTMSGYSDWRRWFAPSLPVRPSTAQPSPSAGDRRFMYPRSPNSMRRPPAAALVRLSGKR